MQITSVIDTMPLNRCTLKPPLDIMIFHHPQSKSTSPAAIGVANNNLKQSTSCLLSTFHMFFPRVNLILSLPTRTAKNHGQTKLESQGNLNWQARRSKDDSRFSKPRCSHSIITIW